MAVQNEKAVPLADEILQSQLLQLVQEAAQARQLKKGANETTKALNKGRAELVLLAADADPLEILLHLPLLCEDKNSPYVFVTSKLLLGRACGVSRAVIAVAIVQNEGGPLQAKIDSIRNTVELL